MKIIFLDLDGVLNLNGPANDGDRRLLRTFVDPAKMAMLNLLCDITGAKVVLSATWRIGKTRTMLAEEMIDAGFLGTLLDRTPSGVPCSAHKPLECSEGHRGAEIAKWLSTARDIDSFVIIDDSADMGDLLPRLVHVDGSVGLQVHDLDLAFDVLQRPLDQKA